jgi:cysteine desulfurase
MKPFWNEQFYNPSSLYEEAVSVKKVVGDARQTIARLLSVQSREIIITGSGTESANMAVLGVYEAVKKNWKKDMPPHIIVSAIEHPAVLESAREVARRGGTMSSIAVSEKGIVNVEELKRSITPETILVSVMYANNEIGTVQPIREIGTMLKEVRAERLAQGNVTPLYFYTDASQAFNYCDCTVSMLGVDLMTLDGSKVYGPKGAGLLVVRGTIELQPVIYGGGQEQGKRSGTENVPLLVGFAKALEIAHEMRKEESKRLTVLRDSCIEQLLKAIPSARLNGDEKSRLPNNVNICIPHIDSEFAVIKLDREGIACSSASSCSSHAPDSRSYVSEALGHGTECAGSSLRFTFGRGTTEKEIERLIKIVSVVVKTM